MRVLGASAYGAEHVIASRDTCDLIVERGEHDMRREIERFPRLFRAVESVPGLTWPDARVPTGELTLWLGRAARCELMQLGRGHTKGDTVAWLPQEKILFSRRSRRVRRDAVYAATPTSTDWPADARRHRRARPCKARARPRRVVTRPPT